MSTELDRLDAQLEGSLAGGAWHGPSVLEALQDVTAEVAYAHPVAAAHSIWELVLHLIGITQHDLYHAGQIAILKKACREGTGGP
jgi:hypothetical protein